jgi:hypothetical protein
LSSLRAPSTYRRTPSSLVSEGCVPLAKDSVRVQRAEKLSAPRPQELSGLPAPQSKLSVAVVTTMAGVPLKVLLAKYSPRQRSEVTEA